LHRFYNPTLPESDSKKLFNHKQRDIQDSIAKGIPRKEFEGRRSTNYEKT